MHAWPRQAENSLKPSEEEHIAEVNSLLAWLRGDKRVWTHVAEGHSTAERTPWVGGQWVDSEDGSAMRQMV